ncbi:hypothetical protein LCGC14_0359140 [marine sediment metagenome]|uniref:Fibronectin type-III domain-containing protein n=1 Tax=marine sediment metagenome TaxID=412755 RepID=A0A0F9TE63_9ZZZZ|nr:fibronectin type III domain-containing protein [Candidatus Aminicenantes bacterium]
MKQTILTLLIVLAFAVTVQAANITLSWKAPTMNADNTELTDLAGYTIYYGTASGDYLGNKQVVKPTGSIPNLTDDTTYYFMVTAHDTVGNESDPSDEVYVTTLAKDNGVSPAKIEGLACQQIVTINNCIGCIQNPVCEN